MGNFNLDNYDTVPERIQKFYKLHPKGRIITNLIKDEGNIVIFKSLTYVDEADVIKSTGYATETKGDGFVNKTCHLENCETSAVGRALANMGLHGDKRPSREEMEKVQRGEQKPAEKPKKEYDYKKLEDEINVCQKIKQLIPVGERLKIVNFVGNEGKELFKTYARRMTELTEKEAAAGPE